MVIDNKTLEPLHELNELGRRNYMKLLCNLALDRDYIRRNRTKKSPLTDIHFR